MKRNSMKRLIKLIIVVAILAITGAIVLPRFMSGGKSTQETAERAMISYVTNLRPDIAEWGQPQCTKRSGYVTCTISGMDKKGEYQIIAAECAVGWAAFGEEGCKPPVARIR